MYTFTPIDYDDALLAVEPEVPSPKLQGFPWEKLKQDVRLLQELWTSLYTYITRGKYPMWYRDMQDLVEYGIARFMGEGEVIVEEPMALVRILRYFEAEGFTIDGDIRVRMESAKGSAFEEAVLLLCTRLFRVGPRLCDVFSFEGDVPDWAHQRAYIMSRKGQELEVSDIVDENPVLPSAGVAHYAENPNDVKDWIISKRSTWCIPGRYMGPDLLAWLRLDDGKLLLLLIQAKCYLPGNLDTLVPKATSKAIQSLNPDNFYSKVKSAKGEMLSMLAAINTPDECFTGVRYTILRVVAAYPLNAGIDSKRSKEVRSAIDADPHPLATMRHAPLLSSLATYDGTPTILSVLARSLKRPRNDDVKDDARHNSKRTKSASFGV